MNSFYSMSDESWPLVKINIWRNPNNMNELEEFFDACRSNLYDNISHTDEKFVMYIDPSGLGAISPNYIFKLVEFLKEMEPDTQKHIEELGLYVKSPVARKIVEWIQVLRSPVVPWKMLSNEKEIDLWMADLQNRQILFPL